MSTTRARSAAGRRIISVRRGLSSAAVGIAAGGVAAMAGAPEIAPLLSWAVAVVVLLTRVWRICWRMDSDGTERLAEAEGRSRSTDAWVLVAAVASLGAVVNALVRFSGNRDATAVALVVLGVLAVILSWALAIRSSPSGTPACTTAASPTGHLHALLSYLFGTGILAVAVNLVTNIANQ
jgi:uncharacterized membrane protein